MPVLYRAQEILEKLKRLDIEPADALEDQWLDFKEWPSKHGNERANLREQRKTAIEAAVCFANAQGGTAVFGVNNKAIGIAAACQGVPKSADIESMERAIIDSTDPKVFPKFEWLEVSGVDNPLLLMFVEPAAAPPCSSTQGWSFRVNKNCLSLTGSLIRSLYFQDTSPSSSQTFVNQVVERLLNALQGDDSREANTAVKALAKIGEASMNELIGQWMSNYTDGGDINVIERIRNTWASMKEDHEIAEYVISRLNGEGEDRLPAFIAASAVIASEQAIGPIGNILKQHLNHLVRAQAARSLAEISDPRSLALLNEQLLVEEDAGVLKELMDRIGVRADSIPGFCKQIRHPAWPIRERAARALGDAGSGDFIIIQALDEATSDTQYEVILTAINSLKMIGGEAAENALKKVLDDSARTLEIRGTAIQALMELRQKQVA